MAKCYVMLHKWGVYGDCGQDVIAVFKDEESAINGFKRYIEDAVERGDYFLSKVLNGSLQRKDIELAEFEFDDHYYIAESLDGELLDEIWCEVHTLR